MKRRFLQTAAVLVCLAVSACAEYPTGSATTAAIGLSLDGGSGLALASVSGRAISGVVLAPSSAVPGGGGNVIAAGGGNVVAAGGGNVVAAGGGNFAVLALGDEVPVPGAQIQLADLMGRPLDGLSHVVTDAHGRYTVHNVPPDTTYMVVARFQTPTGATAVLSSLGHTGAEADHHVVSVATTLVTGAFLQGGASPADFSPVAFEEATAAVDANLDAATMPDLSQAADVAAKAAAIAGIPAVSAQLEKLKVALPAAPAAEPSPQASPEAAKPTGKKSSSSRRKSRSHAPAQVQPNTGKEKENKPSTGEGHGNDRPPAGEDASAPTAPTDQAPEDKGADGGSGAPQDGGSSSGHGPGTGNGNGKGGDGAPSGDAQVPSGTSDG